MKKHQSWLGSYEVERLLRKCEELEIHVTETEKTWLKMNQRGRSKTKRYCSLLRSLEYALRERMAIAEERIRR